MKVLSTFLTSVLLCSWASPALAATSTREDGPYKEAMTYVQEQGILMPLSDGLMHPELPISRQDVVVSVVRDVYSNDIRPDCFDRISGKLPATFSHLFTDVAVTNAHAQEICVGMFVGLVEGQKNGSFVPQASANLVDVAKVVTKAYGIAPLPSLRIQSGVPWHEPFWFALAKRNAIPETVKSRSSALTRGEFAEILHRIQAERPTQGFRYQPTMVKDIAQEHPTTDVAQNIAYPTVSVLDSVAVSVDTHEISTGLLLQMRIEQRRIARLEKAAMQKDSLYGFQPEENDMHHPSH